MANHCKNFGRSNAVCQTALDFILNECLTAMVSIVVPSVIMSLVSINLHIHQEGNLNLENLLPHDYPSGK